MEEHRTTKRKAPQTIIRYFGVVNHNLFSPLNCFGGFNICGTMFISCDFFYLVLLFCFLFDGFFPTDLTSHIKL